MKWTIVCIVFMALSATVLAHNNGGILIKIDGQSVMKYVLSTDGDAEHVKAENRSITLQGGGRVYIGKLSFRIPLPQCVLQLRPPRRQIERQASFV